MRFRRIATKVSKLIIDILFLVIKEAEMNEEWERNHREVDYETKMRSEPSLSSLNVLKTFLV